jgi:hypothetical protein
VERKTIRKFEPFRGKPFGKFWVQILKKVLFFKSANSEKNKHENTFGFGIVGEGCVIIFVCDRSTGS